MDRRQIAAIRWGYGFGPGMAPGDDPGSLLAGLSAPPPAALPPLPPLEEILSRAQARRMANRAAREGDPRAGEMIAETAADVRALRRELTERRLIAPLVSPHGFVERLVSFWADHFTVGARGLVLSLLAPHHVDAAIRPNIAGRFAELLTAAETHPAMLVYLDQDASVGPDSPLARRRGRGLNENLAREILELHTLGVGGAYRQQDVRELAELLTGLTTDLRAGPRFEPRLAQPGAETVLGRRYGGDPASMRDVIAVLSDLAVHPDTARHIARKLCVHFVSDRPDPDHVARVEAAWNASGGDLPAVYAALLDHPAAWAPGAGKARQPFDWLIAALRAFAVAPGRPETARMLRRAPVWLARMGQPLMRPPGPDGWPEEAEAWITPQGLAGRIAAAQALARLQRDRDPREFVDHALGGAASAALRRAAAAAEQRWEGLALVLLSPEFNRR